MHWSSLEWFNLVLFIITGHAIPANELYKPVSHPILTIYIYIYIHSHIFGDKSLLMQLLGEGLYSTFSNRLDYNV